MNELEDTEVKYIATSDFNFFEPVGNSMKLKSFKCGDYITDQIVRRHNLLYLKLVSLVPAN